MVQHEDVLSWVSSVLQVALENASGMGMVGTRSLSANKKTDLLPQVKAVKRLAEPGIAFANRVYELMTRLGPDAWRRDTARFHERRDSGRRWSGKVGSSRTSPWSRPACCD